MICKDCGFEMILDDVDRHSKGNCDKYWICNKCNIGCVEKIRVNKDSAFFWQED